MLTGTKIGHRGIPYSVVQQPDGAWSWKVLPANMSLHAYDFSIASGFRSTREAADAAARAVIDAQLDA